MIDLPSHVVDMLAKPNPAVIGTVHPTGAPVTVPTWYLLDGGRVLVNMDAGRRRLEHMRSDSRISLTVLGPENWYQHVSLRGRVVSLEDDPDLVDIDRLAQHYTGQPYPERARPRISAWIEIDSWHDWNLR